MELHHHECAPDHEVPFINHYHRLTGFACICLLLIYEFVTSAAVSTQKGVNL